MRAVFDFPVPKGMLWADLEALLIAAGATLTEGVRFPCQVRQGRRNGGFPQAAQAENSAGLPGRPGTGIS